jgi:hypothetical protein
MNSTLPIICGTLLTAMVGAGVSHYWSVQSMVATASFQQQPAQIVSTAPTVQRPIQKIATPVANTVVSQEPSAKSHSQEEFFNELLAELKQLKNENRDLRDLMGETNRDVMKLSFRVDTHSESFRPLPTSEQRQETSFNIPDDSLPGVLPPRANPVQGFSE